MRRRRRPVKPIKINRTAVILWSPVILFVLLFIREIWLSLRLFWAYFRVVFLFPVGTITQPMLEGFNILVFNFFFAFLPVFLIWLFLFSIQSLLPVNTLQEVYRTCYQLIMFIFKRHGMAIFVKDGKRLATQEELKRPGPGVVVIDFNSAVVLAERILPPGIRRWFFTKIDRFIQLIGLRDPFSPTRVVGPGIAFTRPNESFRAVVDLRKQFRLKPANLAYTIDGIEVKANVLAIFTVGQDPDILEVTYAGDFRPENLRVVRLRDDKNGFWVVEDLSDELEASDKEEIHRTAWEDTHYSPQLEPYQPTIISQTPMFNADRVRKAVSSVARDDKNNIVPWTDLPTNVAADVYRQLMFQVNYDELYRLQEITTGYPLKEYRARFRNTMRNYGILGYKLVFFRNYLPLQKGMTYPKTSIRMSAEYILTNSKPLRDKGIKITMSSFSELTPVDPKVYQTRIEAWSSSWKRDTQIKMADSELKAQRIRNRARADMQREIYYRFNEMFSHTDVIDETLALNVLQALETAAADPETRNLLPADTIRLLEFLRTVMLPGEGFMTPPL